MITRTLVAAALLSAPAWASGQGTTAPTDARIRDMARYLEAVVDPQRGVYIRAYTGQWYYARVRDGCSRLTRTAQLRFNASPGGDFDRDSSIRADGFHCFVDSVTASEGPPRR
jgi:hypothetical protein